MADYVKSGRPEQQWLEHYPAGVPTEVDTRPFASLGDMLARSCSLYAAGPAFTIANTVLTFAELDHLSRHFASYLQQLGLRRGEPIAIMLPNLLQYPIVLFDILRARMVAVASSRTNPPLHRRTLPCCRDSRQRQNE
ncbi:AMP-binding protein [Cupriavidus sp. WKF15]|uniref:AMP-binding protein n=1 Tax=Cupriavidus sp. WKF15 TaxID=3032282 RepID=UPI0023E288F9|nr:AMP-binding protein [Cupriavidus sp. WKF15]WER50925.1 AMP-binding protein [Cupriavidus sp. WKF15]